MIWSALSVLHGLKLLDNLQTLVLKRTTSNYFHDRFCHFVYTLKTWDFTRTMKNMLLYDWRILTNMVKCMIAVQAAFSFRRTDTYWSWWIAVVETSIFHSRILSSLMSIQQVVGYLCILMIAHRRSWTVEIRTEKGELQNHVQPSSVQLMLIWHRMARTMHCVRYYSSCTIL
jgi:hypothetical protein